jgi:hypothetical protein
MLVALLTLSMQQHVLRHFFSDARTTSIEAEKQLTVKQSLDSASNLSIVNNDTQLTFALVLAFSFLLFLFPLINERKVTQFALVPLSRNFCCIVPKGP